MVETFGCTDCGKIKPIPEGPGGTGYTIVTDHGQHGSVERKICYECSAVRLTAGLIAEGNGTLYLVEMTGALHGHVSDWTGELKFNVLASRKTRHNIGRWQTHVYFKGPDGLWWHGKQIGDNQICYVHRLARQDRKYA